MLAATVLQVNGLTTSFQTDKGLVRAVDEVSFAVPAGKTLGVVGESGCGKSVTALSLLRLLPKPAGVIESGEVLFGGRDLLKLTPEEMHQVRGRHISMIFQEPMTALNPVQKIGEQLREVFYLHFSELSATEVTSRSLAVLRQVGLAAPERRLKEYPHQLSGGMRQRVMIAMALACEPDVLIADEPTTALDVTIQAQILEVMRRLQKERGMAIVFITHDLGVIAELCDEVIVMYGGRVVEVAPVADLFSDPRHPYTKGLLASIPRLDGERKTVLKTIEGMVPSLHDMPAGCRFAGRCPYVYDACHKAAPVAEWVKEDHQVSCFAWKEASGPR